MWRSPAAARTPSATADVREEVVGGVRPAYRFVLHGFRPVISHRLEEAITHSVDYVQEIYCRAASIVIRVSSVKYIDLSRM
jgi:hypothetical protein